MTLSDLTRQVGGLRGRGVEEAVVLVRGLLDELAAVVEDDEVADETVISLVTNALRSVRPRAPRHPGRRQAIAALRAALDAGPRRQGRPEVDDLRRPHTVWMTDVIWETVQQHAARCGISHSAAVTAMVTAFAAGQA